MNKARLVGVGDSLSNFMEGDIVDILHRTGNWVLVDRVDDHGYHHAMWLTDSHIKLINEPESAVQTVVDAKVPADEEKPAEAPQTPPVHGFKVLMCGRTEVTVIDDKIYVGEEILVGRIDELKAILNTL